MVVMEKKKKKRDKANPWDCFIITCMSIISALPSSTLHCSCCFFSVISMLSLSILLSFIAVLVKFCIQQSEWPITPSLHFLASLLSFLYHSSCSIFFCSSIHTAREKHSSLMNGTKYSRSPTSAKPSLPTSNPLWLPGVFHVLITMVIILHLHCSPYPPLHVQLFPIR